MAIRKDGLVEKKNVLNELRTNNMSLQELRFFSIYLSKINAREQSTRVVKFTLDDFKKIMELGRLNVQHLKNTTDNLLCKIVHIPTESGGYSAFQLFKECKVDKDENDEWHVEIDAHDKALPLMFDFKKNYFTYELWNALRLSSSNQVRMYELLKQHQKQGEWTYTVQELRELLGIGTTEYPRFGDFKTWVINKSQQALAENTDINFDYELIKSGRNIVKIRFIIRKNSDYIDQLTLDEFINQHEEPEDDFEESQQVEFKNENLELLSEACNNEFTEKEMALLFDLVVAATSETIPSGTDKLEFKRFHYLKNKYDDMNRRNPEKSRFGYLKKLLEADGEGK